MDDPTEALRKIRAAEIEAEAASRKLLEERVGKVWNTEELRAEFIVKGFMAPFVVVSRKSDGAVGSVEFQPSPRLYFNWRPD